MTTAEKRKELIEHLHWGGSKRSLLTSREWTEVYLQCNGFGEVDFDFAANQLGWDWSHVRDSDEKGIERAWNTLQKILKKKNK